MTHDSPTPWTEDDLDATLNALYPPQPEDTDTLRRVRTRVMASLDTEPDVPAASAAAGAREQGIGKCGRRALHQERTIWV